MSLWLDDADIEALFVMTNHPTYRDAHTYHQRFSKFKFFYRLKRKRNIIMSVIAVLILVFSLFWKYN